jgi:purine-nucleoside phosphorylase
MHPEAAPVAAAARALAERFGDPPRTAVTLGSGLGILVDAMTDCVSVPYEEVGLPAAGVAGHAGVAHVGTLGGHRLLALAGRKHLYEGVEAGVVVRYVRALHAWGVGRLVITCSVGGITPGLGPGHLVVVNDHLNFQRTNPLVGPAFGTRFPDLSTAYDAELRRRLIASAKQVGAPVHEGVLAAMNGPAYETPAEVRMLGQLGADIVGMSTVPEILAAAEIGFTAAVLAVVSNPAAGLGDSPLSHDDVTETAHAAGQSMVDTLTRLCEGLD